MSPTGNDDHGPGLEVPILPLQKALETELLPANIEAIEFDFEICEKLYESLLAYHQRNRIQAPLVPDTVMPNLSFISHDSGVFVQRDCPPYVRGTFIPRNGSTFVPIDDIKRSLPFADSVVIEDPIFAFCRGVLCSVYHESRPPFSALKQSLIQIAELRPLLEARLLKITAFLPEPVTDYESAIPTSADGAIVVGDVAAATSYRDERVLRIVSAGTSTMPVGFSRLSADQRRDVTRGLMRSLGSDFEFLYRQAEGIVYSATDHKAYSPYLPNEYQSQIYKKLLLKNSRELVSELKLTDLMDLNSGCAIDPAQIDIAQLVNIRNNEEVFGNWRQDLREALRISYQVAQQGHTRFESFQHEMAEKEKHWKASFLKYNKGALKDAMTMAEQVSVSGFRTVLSAGASILVDPSMLLAFATLCYGTYKSARKLEKAFLQKQAEKAVLSFFTAIRKTGQS